MGKNVKHYVRNASIESKFGATAVLKGGSGARASRIQIQKGVGLLAVLVLLIGITQVSVAPPAQAAMTVRSADVYAYHPKLLANKASWSDLRTATATDERSREWNAALLAKADVILTQPKSVYSLATGDLLPVSRQVLDRVYALAFAWRMTEDARYAERLWVELNAASQFPDWNSAHFLDTAEMAHAFAIGHDWLYGYWSSLRRATMLTAVESKAFAPAIENYKSGTDWTTTSGNWNVVTNSGLGLAALSFSEASPSKSDQILQAVNVSLEHGLSAYGDDGGYKEGVTYWRYATEYLVTYVAALKTSTGGDQGISSRQGVARTGEFLRQFTGASGSLNNFGDAWSNENVGTTLLGIDKVRGNSELQSRAMASLTGSQISGVTPRAFIWYASQRAVAAVDSRPDRDANYAGIGATMRSSWVDDMAISTSLRAANSSSLGHNDLDGGSFTLDALGEQWAVELGADNYSLPGYFDTDSQRWDHYRKRAEGQNSVVINPDNGLGYSTRASSVVTMNESRPSGASAVTDLSATYPSDVRSWKRGVALFDGRAQVLVQDEFVVDGTADLWWFMHTRADIDISADGRSAVLTLKDKQLLARITDASPDLRFTNMAAQPLWSSPHPSGQETNTGIRKLAIEANDSTSRTVGVQFAPVLGTDSPSLAPIVPLNGWANSSADALALTGLAVDGIQLDGFDQSVRSYQVEANSVGVVPKVTATGLAGSTIAVKQAAGVPGASTITVSSDGKSVRYHVMFVGGAAAIQGVTSNVTTEQSRPQSVVDNTPYTRWSSTGPAWIVFDFGRPQVVQHAEINWSYMRSSSSEFSLETSADGRTWKPAFKGFVKTTGAMQWSSWQVAPTTTRYVRLNVTGDPTTGISMIEEVAFFGKSDYVKSFAKRSLYTGSATAASVTLEVPATAPLKFTVKNPAGQVVNNSGLKLQYVSDDATIASLDQAGAITAKKAGTATASVRIDLPSQILILGTSVRVADQSQMVLRTTEDAYVQGGDWAATNFRTAAKLLVKHDAAYPSYDRVAYMGWNFAPLQGRIVEAAVLHFNATTDPAIGKDSHLSAWEVSQSWSESTVTFNTRPSIGSRMGYVAVGTNNVDRAMDITDFVRNMQGKSASLAFTQDNGGQGSNVPVTLDGRRSTSAPYLVVTFASVDLPSAPTISTATASTTTTLGQISATSSAAPNSSLTLALYASSAGACPVSANSGRALGSVSALTDSTGRATFALPAAIQAGENIFGKATVGGTASSKISSCVPVTALAGSKSVINVNSLEDGYVQGGDWVNTNFRTATKLMVKHAAKYPQYDRTAYMSFDLTQFKNKTIESAVLSFTASSASGATHISAKPTTSPWSESTLTFANKPSVGGKVGYLEISNASPALVRMDLSQFISASKGSTVSIAFTQDDAGTGADIVVTIDGRRSTNRPVLIVTAVN